ncbi:MAG: AMP-binding protein [Xanthomonadales bacterium]|nr:AMP-binding protein [Xanthomonadales bacterium]
MLTCARWLTDHARQRPEALALVVGEQRLSFAQLEGQVARCAAALRAAGARPGDRVATLLPNGLAALLICQAAPRIGAVQEGNSGHPDFRRRGIPDTPISGGSPVAASGPRSSSIRHHHSYP